MKRSKMSKGRNASKRVEDHGLTASNIPLNCPTDGNVRVALKLAASVCIACRATQAFSFILLVMFCLFDSYECEAFCLIDNTPCKSHNTTI